MAADRVMKIGTRGSALALWQANWVRDRLQPVFGTVELEIIKTSGDRNQTDPLSKIGAGAGGKGLFVKEIEEALLDRRVDIAVHSSKDLPSVLPHGLTLVAFPEREDPRDALITRDPKHDSLKKLAKGAKVGTSSIRRMAQIAVSHPNLTFADLRGNVDTRLRKLDEGQYDAIILAAAGLKRLGFAERIRAYLDPSEVLPAIGQGALGIEMRADDPLRDAVTRALDHTPTRWAVTAERAFLAKMEGGCQVPVAAHATVNGDRLDLTGLIVAPPGPSPENVRRIRSSSGGPVADAAKIGTSLAASMLLHGGREILDALRDVPPPDHP